MHITIFLDVPTNVTLSDVLQFITGSQKIPAVGFESPITLSFTDVDRLPTAHTCNCTITISRTWEALTADEFAAKMEQCILGSSGFGQA